MPAGELLDEGSRVRKGLVRERFPRSGFDHEFLVSRSQDTSIGQHAEKPAEQALVFVNDLELTAKAFRLDRCSRIALPPQSFKRRKGVCPGQPLEVSQESAPLRGFDAFIRQVVGE